MFRIGIIIITLFFNSCQVVNLDDKRGPRYDVGKLIIQSNQPYSSLKIANIKDMGAKGNGIDDDTHAIQKAASTGKILYIPSGKYLINKTIKLKNSVYGKGKIIASQYVAFNVIADNISINGITIESTMRNRDNAPFSVIVENHDNFKISNTTLINNRIQHINRKNQYQKGLKVIQNTIRADFTPFLRDSIQNDVITVRGIDGVEITNNLIECKNVNRVLKISDNISGEFLGKISVSPYNSKNIFIKDNIINAETDSRKQVIDLYSGTQNVTIQNNSIEANGFYSIIENKTGINTNFTQNTVIKNNVFKSNNSILSFQGSWGALTPNFESGFQNITITNNYLEGISPFQKNDRGLIQIRFFHQVDVTSNEIIFKKNMNRIGISFYSNKATNFSSNILKNGGVQFTLAISNHSAAPYNANEEKILIQSNSIQNGFFKKGYGVISIINIGNMHASLDIIKNKFIQSKRNKFPVINLHKVEFRTVNIKSNIIEKNSNLYLEGVKRTSSNLISVYNESLNSWN